MTEPAAPTLYHPLLLEHDRAPRNARPLPDATHQAELDNPLCGDQVAMRAKVVDDVLVDVAFEARGCAVCRAAASLWTERARGLRTTEARDLLERFVRFCTEPPGAPIDDALGELGVLAGVRGAKARRTCATLAASALAAALRAARPD